MYAALATTDFGLGAEPKRSDAAAQAAQSPDYLIAGSRVQLWLSLSRTPWWSAISIPLAELALVAYRKKQAETWSKKAKEVLQADVFTNVSVSATTTGGSLSIMATTTVDFAREAHAPGRMLEVLRNAGLDPVEEKWQIIQRGPNGEKKAPLKNSINPDDTNNCGWLCQLGLQTAKDTSGGGNNDCGFLCALGLSTPFVIAGGVLLAVILLRK